MTSEQLKDFKHQSIHELIRLNKLCEQEFKIAEWPRWDYELDAGTLTFSQDEVPRVVVDVLVAGTTSKSGGTWLWGWANRNMPLIVIEPLQRVREFGEREEIDALSRDHHPDNEYLGWEMTAMAARVMNAKGAYRCPTENGFVYLIYMDVYFAEQNRHAERKRILCDAHPVAYSTYVCKHLVQDPGQKWFSAAATEENEWPDAWCARCDKVFQREGEWNDRNSQEVEIELLCHCCYAKLRLVAPA